MGAVLLACNDLLARESLFADGKFYGPSRKTAERKKFFSQETSVLLTGLLWVIPWSVFIVL